jgi:hypothetical protein
MRGRGGDFLQVVRRDAGRKAHRDSEAAIQQAERKACGQQHRLVELPIVVLDEIDGALPDFREQ